MCPRRFLLLLATCWLPTVAFAAIEVKIARLATATVNATGLKLRLTPSAEPGVFAMRGTAERVRIGATDFERVALRCDRLLLDPQHANCASGGLDLRLEKEKLLACWSAQTAAAGGFEFQLAPDCATPIDVRKTADAVDLRTNNLALEPLLKWLPSALRGGLTRLNGSATVVLSGPDFATLRGSATATAAGLELPAQALTVEGLNAKCHLTPTATDCQLEGGALLLGSSFIELPNTPVTLAIQRDQERSTLRFTDGETLQMSAQWASANAPIDLTITNANLPGAYDRYLSSWALAAGLPTLQLNGQLSGRAVLDQDRIQTLSLDGDINSAIAPSWSARQVAVALRYASDQTGLPGTLRISELNAGGLQLKNINLPLRSTAHGFALSKASAVALLGGEVGLNELLLEPFNQSFSAHAALSLRALELRQLSQVFGWRALSGTLSGEIPALALKNNVLTTAGLIRANAFNGEILIDGLGLERPFGTAPSLSANVALNGIDLQALTSTFPIGEIRGLLDGKVTGLRLLNWQPTQFDLQLQTRIGGGIERTISQRAVSNLSSIGGGGPAAALQSGVLQFFKTFRYQQIGLQCRLERNICTMDGVKPVGNGYAIVVGAGIPRVDVVGFERRVDFPLLVSRLSAAMAGQAPVIR